MHRRQYIKRLKERERSYAKTSRVEQRRTRQGKEESERERPKLVDSVVGQREDAKAKIFFIESFTLKSV